MIRRQPRLAGLALCLGTLLGLHGCGDGSASATTPSGAGAPPAAVPPASPTGQTTGAFTTSVVPLAGEDLAAPCVYELYLDSSGNPLQGTWVIFERGDSIELWQDPELRDMASALRLALVYAHQCNAASFDDIQPDARKGPGRTLTAALEEFAGQSGHPELARSKLALFGFSAAGVLSLTVAESMPQRILTLVTYDAGSAALELRQLSPSGALEQIPLLMLANADDHLAGTFMTGQFFESGRSAAAPWAFAVQPGLDHCCTLTTAPIVLAWMHSVVPLRQAAPGTELKGTSAYFMCPTDGVLDGNGYTDCQMTAVPWESGLSAPSSVWMPDTAFASAWLAWIQS